MKTKIKYYIIGIIFVLLVFATDKSFAISKEIIIPSFVKQEVKSAEDRIKAISNENTVSFSYITDMHGDQEEIAPIINAHTFRQIGTNKLIDFGVCAGDITTGQYADFESGKALYNLEYYSNMLRDTDSPVLFARGNHDCNTRQSADVAISGNQYYESVLKQLNGDVVFNEDDLGGDYYYKDLEDKKIRICVLNAFNGENYEFVFGDKQLEFVENKVLDFSNKNNPDEWQILFISHTIDESSEHKEVPADNEKMYSIINKFQEEKGTVIAIITGHHHKDSTIIKNNLLIITVRSSSIAYDRENYNNETYSKEDLCFDIFTIDKETKTLYATRIGRGNDRKWSYDINNLKEEKTETREDVTATENPANNIEIKFITNYNNKVIAIVTSEVELKEKSNKTWILSNDKKTYMKVLDDVEDSYTTTFTNINGYEKTYTFNISQYIDNNSPTIDFKYLSNDDGTITAVVTSSEILNSKVNKDWKISDDRHTYMYRFTKNTSNYRTEFKDVFGNGTFITLNATVFEPEIKYLKDSNGTVTAIAISNVKFANTKPTWKLSEDGYSYTKTFNSNQNYTTAFTDIYGNVVNKSLGINEYNKTARVDIKYIKNSDGTVTAIATSNVKFANTKPTWKLSEDGYSYMKTFAKNQEYYTTFTDVFNGKAEKKIEISGVEDFKVTIDYIENADGTITAIATSNVKFSDTKPTWKLSEDEYSYTKIYNKNENYYTAFTDIFGRTVEKQIIVKK